ncbi:hypothetical protein [Methylobrevis albus]|uniref:Uncharacterized protein n=1 Tax=Methylobrevis albus TaxID=2793297 RepID=A0A931MZB2_9HYPH|nr:hypothetical protein [Methylobrevis albus]MBH0237864.1 hypothetical protein [Methylobrevis albus]
MKDIQLIIENMSNEKIIDLVLNLSFKLTVVSRTAYPSGHVSDEKLMMAINEIQHRLTGSALHLRKGEARQDYLKEYLVIAFSEIRYAEMLRELVISMS